MLFNTKGAHYEWFDDKVCSSTPLGSFDLFEHKNEPGSPMYLWSFGIKKECDRLQGRGQRMLQEAIALANGRPIILYVQKHNDIAIHVYQKAGFRIVGKYMGDEAWKMMYSGEKIEDWPLSDEHKKECVTC